MEVTSYLRQEVASAFFGQHKSLRPAQEQTIPPIIAGHHVILSSSTGSGKTEAALAPLVSKYWSDCFQNDTVAIIYVVPTKALANDLMVRLSGPLSRLGIRLGIRHGDRDDVRHRSHPPQILLTTPESLDVLLFNHEQSLRRVSAIVVDEVHILYNTQRGLHLSILLRRLQEQSLNPIQVVALSATLANLENTKRFLFGPDTAVDLILVPGQRAIDAKILDTRDPRLFVELVRKLMEHPTKLLVFADSRQQCETLSGLLQSESLPCMVYTHYSSLSPEVRSQVEHGFASSAFAVCIATSTLELGIDIGDIDAVVLWSAPNSVESYLQRIGRGNRRTHKSSVVACISGPPLIPEALKFMALVEAGRSGELPHAAPYDLYGSVAQQVLSIVGSKGPHYTRVADLLKVVDHLPYINRGSIEEIVLALIESDFLSAHPYKNQVGPGPEVYNLIDYRLIYGNFPLSASEVAVQHESRTLGTIPAINLRIVKPHDIIRFAHGSWTIQKVGPDGIRVIPNKNPAPTKQLRFGFGKAHMSTFLVDYIGRMVYAEEIKFATLSKSVRTQVLGALTELRSKTTRGEIPYIRQDNRFSYLTFAGLQVNQALALTCGDEVLEVNDYALVSSSEIAWSKISADPAAYDADRIGLQSEALSIFQEMLPTDFKIREAGESWLKDASVKTVLERLAGAPTVEVDIDDIQMFF